MSTTSKSNIAAQALSKAVVYFIDGNSRKHYSRDMARGIPKQSVGIARLKKMIEGWADNVQMAIIYDNRTDEELMRYKNGSWS